MSSNENNTPTETQAIDSLRFSSIVRWVIGHEGGYSNNPNDAGGETNWGISKRSYPREDIRALTIDRAAQIYYQDYWKPLRLGEIDDDRLAAKILDTSINAGRNGVLILQRALRERGHNVPQDGFMHQAVIDACNKANIDKLLLTYVKYQSQHYAECITNKPANSVFARGWHNRAWSIYKKEEK